MINGLKSVGIHHISFKPSSVGSIFQVLNIVEADPNFAICAADWWLRRRSPLFKDFHQPILPTYSSICHHGNIALVAGSSFDGARPYRARLELMVRSGRVPT